VRGDYGYDRYCFLTISDNILSVVSQQRKKKELAGLTLTQETS
jgi:hypothetical protein